jgi:hypothetical protein
LQTQDQTGFKLALCQLAEQPQKTHQLPMVAILLVEVVELEVLLLVVVVVLLQVH